MTADGAISDWDSRRVTLNQSKMFVVVSAWIVAPLLCFVIGIGVGRDIYP